MLERFEDSPDQTEIVENVRVRILLQVEIFSEKKVSKVYFRELNQILQM